MTLKGNKGEWSEPYALIKLLADGKLFLGGENFAKIENLFYPILRVIRHEKDRNVNFHYEGELVVVDGKRESFRVPICQFVENARLCFEKIKNAPKGSGAFAIVEIEKFLSDFSIDSLKAKSKNKNDITISFDDPKTFISPTLGFSLKSQLGRPSTLFNASEGTNFIFKLEGGSLSGVDIDQFELLTKFSDKIKVLDERGIRLEYIGVQNDVFYSNLQTIDTSFDRILSAIVEMFYRNEVSAENQMPKFIEKITQQNPNGYNLGINDKMYELMMKRFLSDYALGMRACEPWKRDFQASGGYLIVREDGEIICYHFYFTKNFEDYLFQNTKLETPSKSKHKFGVIYEENGCQYLKLNLQIRFIK